MFVCLLSIITYNVCTIACFVLITVEEIIKIAWTKYIAVNYVYSTSIDTLPVQRSTSVTSGRRVVVVVGIVETLARSGARARPTDVVPSAEVVTSTSSGVLVR